MQAVEKGETETVKSLIDQGADVNAGGELGWTALMYAAREGRNEIVQVLLAAGADANAKVLKGWDKGITALVVAAENGHTVTVKALL